MIGLSGLVRIAKGAIGVDEIEEMASQMGMEIKIGPVQPGEIPPTISDLKDHANTLGAKVFVMNGSTKTGERICAVFTVTAGSRKIPLPS